MNTKRRSFLKTLIGGTIGIFAAKKTVPEIKADNYEKTYQERSLAQPMSGTGVICYSGRMNRITLTGYHFNEKRTNI